MSWRFVCCALFLLSLPGGRVQAAGNDVFHKPVRLEVDGQPIDTGANWGHSGPCIEDVDGDGLADLVVGDFGGKFHFFKNIGQPNQPVYEDAGKLQAGGGDAAVRIYCCVGSQPRFVDLNADGQRDFVSNSYDPGHCYFFRGLADHKFAAREELVDKAGVPVRSEPVQQQDYQSFGSFYTPVDWEGDGDFDLLIGCFDGHLKLRINEGTPAEPVFAAENQTVAAGGEPLKVERHCCPLAVDWNGDGLWDIVAGSDDGSVTWFRNAGTRESPLFEKGIVLVEPHEGSGYEMIHESGDEIVPGIRSQVEVVDYNGDGKLDLLVGDFYTAFDVKDDLSADEMAAFKKLLSQREVISKPFAEKYQALQDEFAQRYPGNAITSDEADKAWIQAYQELRESAVYKEKEKQEAKLARQMRKYLAQTYRDGDRLFDLARPHGFVWLFVQK